MENGAPDILTDEMQRVPIDNVHEHPSNPRDGDIGEIQKSIRQNGFYGALVVQESSGKILAGNHRWRAAQAEGLDEVPVIYVDVGDEEALRILLADNRTSDVAGYHEDQLADLLEHLDSTEDRLAGTGYGGGDLDELLDDLGRIPGNGEVDDPGAETSRAEELQDEWDTERGQLWQIGRHRLLCGDATDEGDVDRLLDGAEPRLMVADPPYGVEYDADWRNEELEGGQWARSTGKVSNDDTVDWQAVWELSPSTVAYCWHAGKHASESQSALTSAGYVIRSQIVWVKEHFAISRGHYHWAHEPCWYAVREGSAEWQGGATNQQCGRWRLEPCSARKRPIQITAHKSLSSVTPAQSATTRATCTSRSAAAARASSPPNRRPAPATRWRSIQPTAPSFLSGAARQGWSAN